MGNDDLKPCPFCGGKATFSEVDGAEFVSDFGGHFVSCTNPICEVSTGLIFACGDDPKPLLAERWNSRWKPNKPSPECNPQDLCAGCRCEYAHGA